MPRISAHWNCDHTYVVWQYDEPIDDCLGFALYRRPAGDDGDGEATHTWVGFEGEVAGAHEMRSSTEWPIQKFMWADFEVKPGDTYCYRVVPITGSVDDKQPAWADATAWTDAVTVEPSDKHGMFAYFNRGVISAQWLAKALDKDPERTAHQELVEAIHTKDSPVRTALTGQLLPALLELLDGALQSDKTIYAALFELEDEELLEKLKELEGRAHVVLGNGSPKAPETDVSSVQRQELKDAGADVRDRIVGGRHFAHNKFLVVCDANGENPECVWTGSTNWTTSGLCTQANNGLRIESEQVASWYRDQWDLLAEAGSDYPESLLDADDKRKNARVNGLDLTAWFTPVDEQADLEEAKALIDGAKQGILFLMFNPGPRGTLLNDIIERNSPASPTYDPDLYIHGVLNQDPSTTKTKVVGLFRRGHFEPANFDVVLPSHIDERFAYWDAEIASGERGNVLVHSKTIVIDPFGENPVVITGSHNMGPKASGFNDDNLVIVRGSNSLAAAYAVNIIGIYTSYRWRYLRDQQKSSANGDGATAPSSGNGAPSAGERRFTRKKDWSGLRKDPTWQDEYFDGPKLRELEFWLGEPVAAPAPAP